MKSLLTRCSIALSSLLSLGMSVAVKAQGDYGLTTARDQTTLVRDADIPTMLGRVLGTVLGFTGTIFFVLVVWAGLLWMTAAGNEDQIKKAQNILKAAIIGLVIILSAYAITRFIGTTLQ